MTKIIEIKGCSVCGYLTNEDRCYCHHCDEPLDFADYASSAWWVAEGSVCGECEHRHRTEDAAERCSGRHHAAIRGAYPSTYPTSAYSDRRPVLHWEGLGDVKIARIFEESTGLYHVCDNSLDHLDARGKGYRSRRDAIAALRACQDGYTHYLAPNGEAVELGGVN